jgi:hypothetical protein
MASSEVVRLQAEIKDLRWWDAWYTSDARVLDGKGREIWKDGCAASGMVFARRERRAVRAHLAVKLGALRALQV